MKRDKKYRNWYPGMYEGKTPEQVQAEVGKAVKKVEVEPVQDCYNWRKLVGRYDRGVNARY